MREITVKGYGVVSFNDDAETKNAVFEKLLADYFFKYESFCGETIMQSDDPQIYAPEVMADIADNIIKFEIKWNE